MFAMMAVETREYNGGRVTGQKGGQLEWHFMLPGRGRLPLPGSTNDGGRAAEAEERAVSREAATLSGTKSVGMAPWSCRGSRSRKLMKVHQTSTRTVTPACTCDVDKKRRCASVSSCIPQVARIVQIDLLPERSASLFHWLSLLLPQLNPESSMMATAPVPSGVAHTQPPHAEVQGSPHGRFFLHSTQLSQVLDKYDTCFANITAMTKVLAQKKEALPDLLTAFCEASTTIEVLFDHELQLSARFFHFWFNVFSAMVTPLLFVSRTGHFHCGVCATGPRVPRVLPRGHQHDAQPRVYHGHLRRLGSRVRVDESSKLGPTDETGSDKHGWLPIPKPWQFGLNHGLESLEEMDSEKEEADWVDTWKEHPGTEDSVDNERPEPSSPFKRSMRQRPLPRKEHEQLLTSTKCEMFPFQRRLMGTMDASGEAGVPPLHMCLQPAQPFMRPHDGIDFAHLGICSCLKAINAEIVDAQSAGYGDIADEVHIKGWLMIGHGLQHVCGMQLIEGMVKEDIRWDVLQNKRGVLDTVVLWCLVGMAAILFAAGSPRKDITHLGLRPHLDGAAQPQPHSPLPALYLTAAGSVVNDVLSSAKGRGGTHVAFAARGPQGSRRHMDPVQRIGVRVLSSTGVNEEMEVCGEAEVQETAEAEEGCGEVKDGRWQAASMTRDAVVFFAGCGDGMHHAMADEPKTRKQWAAAHPVTVAVNSMPAQDTVLPAQSNMECAPSLSPTNQSSVNTGLVTRSSKSTLPRETVDILERKMAKLKVVRGALEEEVEVRQAHQETEGQLNGVAVGLRVIVKDSVKEVVYLSNNRTAECKLGILGANSQSVLTLVKAKYLLPCSLFWPVLTCVAEPEQLQCQVQQ
ncbi:hypothetical protein B0H10DRAFT_2387069 [Mycena sp. CBHHK59/15]|nr:hypothetical protein B0H10DRAFT_2387069 [Mycena sp. CBHHK59/15]